MTGDETDLLLAEYVLGTIAPDDRRALEARLAREPELRAGLAKWERRLVGLGGDAEEVPVRDGLWDGIAAAIEAPAEAPSVPRPESGFLTIRAGEGEWAPLMEGVEKKLLFQDPAEGVETFLVRIAPKTGLPAHGHEAIEECLVLEGDVVLAGQHLRAGDFQAAFPGVHHQDIYSDGGCLLYVRGEIR